MKMRNDPIKKVGRFIMRMQYNSDRIQSLSVYSRLEWILFMRNKIIKAISKCDDSECSAFWQGKIHECVNIHSDLLIEARNDVKNFAVTVTNVIKENSNDEN
jgi:hypothetical protein